MPSRPRLDAYHFHEQEWASYDELREGFEWEVPNQFNIAGYVCDRWAGDAGRTALFAENQDGDTETISFRDLQRRADRLAGYLASIGVARGDRVAVNTPQKPATVISHLAIWKGGGVSVPQSTLFGSDALAYRLRDCDATVCIVDASNAETVREVRPQLPSLQNVIVVDAEPEGDEVGFQDALNHADPEFTAARTDAEETAIIIYTSGTTGDPKGVVHAHRVLLGHLPLFITTFCNMAVEPDSVFWTPSEWAWIASLFDVVLPSLYYGRPVVAYHGGPFDPATAYGIIQDYTVTNLFVPPTGLRMMTNVDPVEAGYDVGSVRVVTSGGEALGQDIVDWAHDTMAGAVVHEGYGQTEANVIVGDCTALFDFREGKMGRAGPGHHIRIVDPDTAAPINDTDTVGEIAVRYPDDPVCFQEYLNKPEQTAEKIKDGWLLTGDLGSVDPDGYFTFKSRKDDVIISAGYRIGPEEIEETLATHDAVADAGVIGVPDPERGEVPKAFVVLAQHYTASDDLREALKDHVRDRLAQYEYPRHIEFIDDLPKTTTGKTRRAELRET